VSASNFIKHSRGRRYKKKIMKEIDKMVIIMFLEA
jgi:hypothetical protein